MFRKKAVEMFFSAAGAEMKLQLVYSAIKNVRVFSAASVTYCCLICYICVAKAYTGIH